MTIGMLHRVRDLREQDPGLSSAVLKMWRDQAEAHQFLSEDAVTLLEHLLEPDPKKRWTRAQALESAYVQDPPTS